MHLLVITVRNEVVQLLYQSSHTHIHTFFDLLKLFNIQSFANHYLFCTTICPTPGPFKDCYQVRQAGYTTSGMYLLKTDNGDRLIQAWCEHGLDNGGWTVLQRRRDGSVNFFRNWENYKVSSGYFTQYTQMMEKSLRRSLKVGELGLIALTLSPYLVSKQDFALIV